MARKEQITKEMILNTAFDLTRKEGIDNVTARKLAAEIGCSTQPIFRVYANMNELYSEIYQKAIDAFGEYYENFESKMDTPFIHLGLAYINYAKEERKLFQLLFQSDDRGDISLYELLNGQVGAVSKEISKAAAAGCKNPSGLFMKMWIFIHGCACMVLTGDYDLTEEETIDLLQDMYKSCS
ncbi:MAG: TetR/AcrR family transcriptional regulator [Lachnospiraceae bacterium]|nr:TetR/AcrR family transcriptional regulator [Lachnospiraceae bacterium]MEE0920221.1 TetR-like C-terminal domain-containing protein [Lachnospiraceae bacterium]